jgi:hypothetical protein
MFVGVSAGVRSQSIEKYSRINGLQREMDQRQVNIG